MQKVNLIQEFDDTKDELLSKVNWNIFKSKEKFFNDSLTIRLKP